MFNCILYVCKLRWNFTAEISKNSVNSVGVRFWEAFLRTFFRCSEQVCLELTLSLQPCGETRTVGLVDSFLWNGFVFLIPFNYLCIVQLYPCVVICNCVDLPDSCQSAGCI